MSLYRTDTKILSIPEYTPFIDVEAEEYYRQWRKDPTKFKYQITLQISAGLIMECPAGIFVNILYTSKKKGLATFKKLQEMFKPINGQWYVVMSTVMYLYEQKADTSKKPTILDVEVA